LDSADIVVGVLADGRMRLRRATEALRGRGFEVAALAFEVGELVLEASGAELDVVVYDCDERLADVLANVARVRKHLAHVRVVAVVDSAPSRAVRRMLDAGIDGVVLSSQLRLVLRGTVRTVFAGQLSIPRDARVHASEPILSYRERQVLGGVTAGLCNRDIAGRMHVSESTVKSHLSSAFKKLGVSTRDEAVGVLTELRGAAQLVPLHDSLAS
jgi:two-component system response regulator DesR